MTDTKSQFIIKIDNIVKGAYFMVEKSSSNFDKLPVVIQLLIGVGALLLIAVIGFVIFFAVDILLLDFDPVGKAFASLGHMLGR